MADRVGRDRVIQSRRVVEILSGQVREGVPVLRTRVGHRTWHERMTLRPPTRPGTGFKKPLRQRIGHFQVRRVPMVLDHQGPEGYLRQAWKGTIRSPGNNS